MSRRTDQSASVLHRAVQQVITRGFADPRLDGCLLTVTDVKVSPDLREAIIRLSVLPAEREKRAIAAIQAAAKHIRHEVDTLVRARRTPKLLFRLDSAAKRQAGVLAALAKARAENPDLLEGDAAPHLSDPDHPQPGPGDQESSPVLLHPPAHHPEPSHPTSQEPTQKDPA